MVESLKAISRRLIPVRHSNFKLLGQACVEQVHVAG